MVEEASRMSGSISEYTEARDRFNKFSKKGERNNYTACYGFDGEFGSNSRLDEIILKLCKEDSSIEIGNDWSLFYEVILYSDFLQLKSDLIETFYSELCNNFILSHLIENITRNLNEIKDIPHTKTYIVKGLCKTLQVVPVVENDILVLRYSEKKMWSNVNWKNVSEIRIMPCAYKVLMSHGKFNLIHLNFIFKLLQVENINLNDCNLNGRDIQNLFEDLELKSLTLSECGTSVNAIIENNFAGALKHLRHLNLSNNPLFNDTLKNIRWIPLKSLDISGCIKISGKFINSTWFSEKFRLESYGKKAEGNIDILWEQGILKENIEVLNASHNIIHYDNLQKILQLNLKELDITGSLKIVEFSKVTFPESLQILKTKKNEINFDEFQALCKTKLKTLELTYCGKENEDFSYLIESHLRKNLKELSVCVSDPCENFIAFISKFQLKSFHCELTTDECFIDSFIADYPEERRHLESLSVDGPALDVSEKFVLEFKKLNLTELSLSLPYSSLKFSSLLCCENLQQSIVKLSLDEEDVKTEDLIQILLFKKLKKLSFQYSNNIDTNFLERIVKMNTLKELKLKAVVRGELNLNIARALCIAPVETLIIYDDYYRSVSEEALNYLSTSESSLTFSKNLVTLHMRTSINSKLASILKAAKWEYIYLERCSVADKDLKLFLDNKNLIFTLHHLKFDDLDVNWEYISQLNLSKLYVLMFDLPDSAVPNLAKGSISKFLSYLFLEDYKIGANLDLLLQTNISQVDTY